MAFKVLGTGEDLEQIWVVTDSELIITGVQRQDMLFEEGFHFEAAMAQATLVEGLLLQYLLVAKQVRGFSLRSQTEERLRSERITFGQVKDELREIGAFHESALDGLVSNYVSERNKVAHHLCGGKHEFDFVSFYSRGRDIAFRLWHHVLEQTERHRLQNP